MGTKTYMAPEIIYNEVYDGKKSDVFSLGVILFIMTLGIFPFPQALKDNRFYQMLNNQNFTEYWDEVGGDHLSE